MSPSKSQIPSLGRVKRVPLRDVWPNEATSFTPWLLQNQDVLSEVLQLDISLEESEARVGRYSLDLLGVNNEDNSKVIVENQLENTNHGHLGQLLVYAAGMDAKTVVWIASEFRAEHRQALDWLNRVSDRDTHFYGVEVEAVQIGDSLPAPQLSLVVEPNSFSEDMRAEYDDAWMRERGSRYKRFWTQFFEVMSDDFPEFSSKRPSHRQYVRIPTAWTLCSRVAAFNKNSLRVEIRLGSGDEELNAARWEELVFRKELLEEVFGEELDWNELEGRKASRISFYREASILEEEAWHEYVDWLRLNLRRLTAVTESKAFSEAMRAAEGS